MSQIDSSDDISSIQVYKNQYYPDSQYEHLIVECNSDGIKFFAEGRTKEFRIKLDIDSEFRLLDVLLDHTHKLAGLKREKL